MNGIDDTSSAGGGQVPAAPAVKHVKGEGHFSPIWIVPIVALLIGAFLVYRVVTETGPTITITFTDAPGVEAGKTKIKYKDIIVGQVTAVDMSKDIKNVIVSAEMSPKAKPYLTDKTKFWVVKPQISSGGISGLGTLLSGNYIGMDPSAAGSRAREFTGLERMPIVHSTEAGSEFRLRASRLGSINFGSPVYYKDIPVGEVIDYSLQDDGNLMLDLFIREPYDKRVNSATRFWNASGFNVSLSANGLELNTESLAAIVAGGIAFDTAAGLGKDAGKPPAPDQVFNLYASLEKSRQPSYHEKRRLLLYFNDSVRGLSPGAPVEIHGYEIGRVSAVDMEYDPETMQFRVPVLIDIEPQRVTTASEGDFKTTITALVGRGLRGQLKTGNLVLGQLLVSLDFFPDAPPATVDFSGKYPVLPTVQGKYNAIMDDASALVRELRQAGGALNAFLASDNLRDGVLDLSATIANLKRLTAELQQTTAPELARVLTSATATLTAAQSMFAPNGTTRTETNRLLQELTQAARSIRLLADYLEQHPESIIRGKE
jgi:paraquat-inducible protein B